MEDKLELEKDTEGTTAEKKRMKVVFIRTNVLFPGQILSFELDKNNDVLRLMEESRAKNEDILVIAEKNPGNEGAAPEDAYDVGTTAHITQILRLPNDAGRAVVRGGTRMKALEYVAMSPFEAIVEPFGEDMRGEAEDSAIINLIKEECAKTKAVGGKLAGDVVSLATAENPDRLICELTYLLCGKDSERQAILEISSKRDQLEALYKKLVASSEVLEAEKRISQRVKESVDKNQKEYYLREQIKAIHDELGDDEEEKDKYLQTAKDKKLPDYAVEKLQKEMNRMDKMAANSPEAGVIRTYIEWLLDLPWGVESKDDTDLNHARQVLDADHYGLEKIKERIIEYLAVHKLTENNKGTILCFVGPPGVGKTSIVESIARAAGRKFVQMSLGGVRDEAEIRGHRRTYIGAMPGRILSGMKSAGVNNPVFLLDEIDKMSSDFRGDPASAMLEVLDPNQNDKFKDHYLEIPYDLSKVMFVATANTTESIPAPLLDRMELIDLTGYTYAEKLQIAKRYLVPKQIKNNGMIDCEIKVSDAALNAIVSGYTRESGVRGLEREIGSLIRKLAVKRVSENQKEFTIEKEDLKTYLGAVKFREDEALSDDCVGVANGLAWTSVGGVTLKVETALIPEGKGEIILTGNMGDVMKESCRIAVSVVRSRMTKYSIPPEKFTKYDLHVHIPEGATPKDGPSAGITLSTAVMSLMTGRKVRGDVAMTGEVTLTGRVLAIGGLKEKSLAAVRSGAKTLIIPEENRKDVDELPPEVKENLEIVCVKEVDEVFERAII
ncbi:MAG: endopeptidase La [Firmicutes bacterium]|nr:endopeptidase La [Bacillota bacterium]MDY5532003.1 endopeptidase La [Pumilibacteraceae bacterium]